MAPGFHGKAPDFGDFLSRRMPAGFLPAWDGWLETLVNASRDRLGAAWHAAWLEMPVWHGVLGPGVAHAGVALVVLIPSVDRVGRCYPMTVLGLPEAEGRAWGDWRRDAERLVLSSLEPGFRPDALDAALVALGPPAAAANGWERGVGPAGMCSTEAGLEPAPAFPEAEAAPIEDGETAWWRFGGGAGAVHRMLGLPPAALAAAFVLGHPEGAAGPD